MTFKESSEGLVEVLAEADPISVHIAHDLLRQRGIESFVFDENSYYIDHNVLVRLVVPFSCFDRALDYLRELGFRK